MQPTYEKINEIDIIVLRNSEIELRIAPQLGGKILGIHNTKVSKEFMWLNKQLQPAIHTPGTEYDANFLGGLDELIPNDIPETIDGIDYPDHGELWTTSLAYETNDSGIHLFGTLPLSQLYYSKKVSLQNDGAYVQLDYLIRNDSASERHFLWKLHAALNIQKGDRLISSASKAQVVDPEYSRFKASLAPFDWPRIQGVDASIIPEANGTMDFFYLLNADDGTMQLEDSAGNVFGFSYDPKVFPYQWWFASYGGFMGHYTGILEPCTNMPLSVNEAAAKAQSALLQPGEAIETTVRIFAGDKNDYIEK